MEANELKTAPAVLQAVIQITRKATGKVEEYVIAGVADAGPHESDCLPCVRDADALPASAPEVYKELK